VRYACSASVDHEPVGGCTGATKSGTASRVVRERLKRRDLSEQRGARLLKLVANEHRAIIESLSRRVRLG